MARPRSFAFARLAAMATLASSVSAAGPLLCGTAGDELVAARAGLEREWVVQIPFDSAGWSLEQVSIGDGMVVATSGDGGIHAVSTSSAAGQPRPGSVLWSQRVGRAGGVGQRAGIGGDVVTVAHDLEIHALNRDDGSLKWRHPVAQLASGGVVPAGDWTYAPLAGNGVMRFPTDPHRTPVDPPAAAAASGPGDTARGAPKADPARPLSLDAGGRVESAPIPFEGGVAWCTTGGRLVAVVPADATVAGSEWARIEFDLGAPPAGPLVVRDSTIYAATTRGDLACIDDPPPDDVHEFTAIWHVVLPWPPEGGPLVFGNVVVVSLGDQGIMALSAKTGDELWRSCATGRLVSITGDRVWCVDSLNRLVSLDLATGMPGAWLCLGSFTLPVTNTVDDRLILASPDGLVVSLAPRRTVSALPPTPPPQPGWRPDEARPAAEEPTESVAPEDATAT